MAKSPSHKLGQIIGELLESSLEPHLRLYATKYDFFLDKKGTRIARGTTKKLCWIDKYNNKHDLDFVFEKGGNDYQVGTPQAFIEVAWRRYTKHSKNKAQEIQGAILPLLETHNLNAPFIGVLLAGDFTEGAITQLKSLGFSVLYFPYITIVEAFKAVGVDVAYDETTPDKEFEEKVKACKELTGEQLAELVKVLYKLNESLVTEFMEKLEKSITRQVSTVSILPLHGNIENLTVVQDAIEFIRGYDLNNQTGQFIKFEIIIRYNNGDKIDAQFHDRETAIGFLSSFEPIELEIVTEN